MIFADHHGGKERPTFSRSQYDRHIFYNVFGPNNTLQPMVFEDGTPKRNETSIIWEIVY